MRPLELRVRNFRSFFGEGHTFDFRDRQLVGIVGPIGSGKSTILDAISFALYGRTPRINRGTKSLIHQRATEATVALRFEVDGEIWEAVRMLRSKGQSQHALYLLEEDVDEPTEIDKVVMEGEVNERIEMLLGFDFDAFGRSVLLAQGQFAEFLNSRPAERDKVLKGVFGHERIDAMRDLAKVKAKDTDHESEKLGIRLEQTEAAMGRLTGRREVLVAQKARLTVLEGIQPEVEKLTENVGAMEGRLAESKARLADLSKLAEKLPDAGWSEDAIGTAERARSRRSELASQLEKAHGEASNAEKALKSDDHQAGSARLKEAGDLIARLEGQRSAEANAGEHLQDVLKRAVSAAGALDAANAATVAAEAGLDAAESASVAANDALAGSQRVLIAAQHADMASSLRQELQQGHDCPVCHQPVHEIPASDEGVQILEAENSLAEARTGRDRAETTLRQATAALEAARSDQKSSSARIAESRKEQDKAESASADATGEVSGTTAALEGLLGEGDIGQLVAAERVALAGVETLAEATRKAVDEIRRLLDEAIAAEQESDRALGDLRTQLVALAAQLNAESELPEDDPGALRDALVALREGWQSETVDLQTAIDAGQAELVADRGRIAELFENNQVTDSLTDALAKVRAEVDLSESEIERDEQAVASASDLIAERERLDAGATRYRRLAADLTDAKFIRFLLDEERTTLGELGSEHFQRLSSGRYRFSDDGTFEVVDLTAADAVRKADSLSGGETFLASLGLALGLSEMVGRTGGRLDAFFLDEGFGTLDHEHLDLAMEGIEALVTDHESRLVVVVSHVPELRHRIEDLIVLERDPVTGDSVIMSGATN